MALLEMDSSFSTKVKLMHTDIQTHNQLHVISINYSFVTSMFPYGPANIDAHRHYSYLSQPPCTHSHESQKFLLCLNMTEVK